MIVSIAWRNLWRNPARSLLTMLALSGSLVIMLLYAALVEGISRQMVTQATDYSSAHLQIHRQTFIDDRDLYATVPWSYLAKMEQGTSKNSDFSVSARKHRTESRSVHAGT